MRNELNEAANFAQVAEQKIERAKDYAELAVSELGKAIHAMNCAKGMTFKASGQVAAGSFIRSCLANELESLGQLVQDTQRQLEKMQMVAPWVNGTIEDLTEVHGGLLLAMPKEHEGATAN